MLQLSILLPQQWPLIVWGECFLFMVFLNVSDNATYCIYQWRVYWVCDSEWYSPHSISTLSPSHKWSCWACSSDTKRILEENCSRFFTSKSFPFSFHLYTASLLTLLLVFHLLNCWWVDSSGLIYPFFTLIQQCRRELFRSSIVRRSIRTKMRCFNIGNTVPGVYSWFSFR